MNKRNESVAIAFSNWLSTHVPSGQMSIINSCFSEIEKHGKKVKILKQPLFETKDLHVLSKLRSEIEKNKMFRFSHKRDMKKMILAMSLYISYMKELNSHFKESAHGKADDKQILADKNIDPQTATEIHESNMSVVDSYSSIVDDQSFATMSNIDDSNCPPIDSTTPSNELFSLMKNVKETKNNSAIPFDSKDEVYRISNLLLENGRYRESIVFLLSVELGLTMDAILSLHVSDFITDNRINNTIIIDFTRHAANSRKIKGEFVLSASLKNSIELYLYHRQEYDEDDFLISSESNRHDSSGMLTRNAIRLIMADASKELGIIPELKGRNLYATYKRLFSQTESGFKDDSFFNKSDPIKRSQEIRRILDYCLSHHRYRDYLMFVLGFCFGLTGKQLRCICFSDLINDDGTFRSEFPVLSKDGNFQNADNAVSIPGIVKSAYDLYITQKNISDFHAYIFQSESSNRSKDSISIQGINRIIKNISKELGLAYRFTAMSFKKTFVYHQLLLGGNSPDINRRVREALHIRDSKNLMIYLNSTDDEFGENIVSVNEKSFNALSLEDNPHQSKPMTITEAVVIVLQEELLLTPQEIYGRIIEKNLYRFGAKNPISVIATEINRACRDSDYTKKVHNIVFGSINPTGSEKEYFLLSRESELSFDDETLFSKTEIKKDSNNTASSKQKIHGMPIHPENRKEDSKLVCPGDKIISYFSILKESYPDFEFTNANARGDEQIKAVYIFLKKYPRKRNVLFEIWHLFDETKFDLYIKRDLLSDEEYNESLNNWSKTSETRGRITRLFVYQDDLIEFLIPKLNQARYLSSNSKLEIKNGRDNSAINTELNLVPLAETIVLDADLEGITIDELSSQLHTSIHRTKTIIDNTIKIVSICGKLIHKESFMDWDIGANQLEAILSKLMVKNYGYVSDAQLYNYARVEMQMFLNDNDMDDQRKVFEMAEHLFEKEKYHGKHYTFSMKTHISLSDEAISSKLDIMLKYARTEGGYIKEDNLESYLQNLGIKTANLRQQMRVYDEPIFLLYQPGEFITAESIHIEDMWLGKIRTALLKLFADSCDHVVLRDIQPWWYSMLPELPNRLPWTPFLLQSVLMHFGDSVGARTIAAITGQSIDTLHVMVVSLESELQTFSDAVIAMILDNHVEERRFSKEDLRRLLVQHGLISENELVWTMFKALPNDERYSWDADEQFVTINI